MTTVNTAYIILTNGCMDSAYAMELILSEMFRNMGISGKASAYYEDWYTDDAVEIAGPDGVVFAKGLVRHPAPLVASWAGRRTSELPDGAAPEVVHRDDLVVLS